MLSLSSRSNSCRPGATTSPRLGNKRNSSEPTCPVLPVSRITRFILSHTVAGIPHEPRPILGFLADIVEPLLVVLVSFNGPAQAGNRRLPRTGNTPWACRRREGAYL